MSRDLRSVPLARDSVDLLRTLCEQPTRQARVESLAYVGDGERADAHVAALMQRGYVVRVGMDRAEITPTGVAFLAGLDWARSEAIRHDAPPPVVRALR